MATPISSVVKEVEVSTWCCAEGGLSHFKHDLSCKVLICAKKFAIVDVLRCYGVCLHGVWCWFACLASELVDGLPGSSARVSEVD